MKIAVVSDEWHPIDGFIQSWLEKENMEVVPFGSFVSKKDEPWVTVTAQASLAVTNSNADEGIFLCWSGTGACMTANKIPGIRAALCGDPETAKLARIWNHANVLIMSNRTLTESSAEQILRAWFEDYDKTTGNEGVQLLKDIDNSSLVKPIKY